MRKLGQLHPSDPASFPAAASLLTVLNLVCSALRAAPDGQLPATLAVFAAEAATLLQHPKQAMAKTLQKLLVRKRDLSLEVNSLLLQAIFLHAANNWKCICCACFVGGRLRGAGAMLMCNVHVKY